MRASTTVAVHEAKQPGTGADLLIDGMAVAKLAGSQNSYFARNIQRRNPTFPRQKAGGAGKGRALWSKAEIDAWLAAFRQGGDGKGNPRFRERKTSTQDNARALRFICQYYEGFGDKKNLKP